MPIYNTPLLQYHNEPSQLTGTMSQQYPILSTIQLSRKSLSPSQKWPLFHLLSVPVKVEAIFRLARSDEEKRLQSCELNNHMLLFHGSSTSNLISILKQGLKVAPSEAPTTGYLFGKVGELILYVDEDLLRHCFYIGHFVTPSLFLFIN